MSDEHGAPLPSDPAAARELGEQPFEEAYEQGRAAALAGEEAAPGCTTTPAGRAWLEGYTAGAAERS